MNSSVGENLSLEIMSEVIDAAYEQIKQNNLTKLEIPYTVESVLAEMTRVLDWAQLMPDPGEHSSAAQNPPAQRGSPPGAKWMPDRQPEQTTIDVWARGVLQAKKRVKKNELADLLKPTDSAQTRMRSNSVRSSVRTPNSHKTPRNGDMDEKASPFMVVEVNEPGESKQKRGPEGFELTPAEAAYMLELKEQQDRAKQEAEEAERRAEAEREFHEQWEQKMQELKGKDYTFGVSGEIILINTIRPEKLPTSAYFIPTVIHDKVNEATAAPSAPVPAKPPKKKKSRKGSRTLSVGDAQSYFTVSPSLQPSIFEVATVGSGVSIKEGQTQKVGPVPLEDALHMSRKMYSARIADATVAATGSVADQSGENDVPDDLSELGDPDNTDLSEDGRDTISRLSVSPVTDVTDLAAVLTGGKRKVTTAVAKPEARDEEEEDLHYKLVNAPDWGAVGPVKEPTVGTLPRNPNKKQRSTTISPRSKKPRDRLAEGAITFTGDSRKLPAPPLGESTGHGLYPRTAVDPDGNPLTARSSQSSSDRSFLPRIPNVPGGNTSVYSGVTTSTTRTRQYGFPGRVDEVSVQSSSNAKQKLGLR